MKRLLWNITLSVTTSALLFVLFFDLESCRKADDVQPTTPQTEQQQNPSVNLKDAKQWLNGMKTAENGRVDAPGGIWQEPIWDGNSSYEFRNGFQILRVDMAGDGLGAWGYREMIFFKDTTGQVDAVIMEVLGFVDYMGRKKKEKGPDLSIKEYIDSDDFSGDIYIYDLQHTFLKGRRYVRNKLVNEFIPVTESASNGRFLPPVPPCEDCGLNSGGSGGGWGTPVNHPPFEVTAPALNNSFPSWSTGVSYRPLVPSELPSWNNNNSGYDMPIGGGAGAGRPATNPQNAKSICEKSFQFKKVIDVGSDGRGGWQVAGVKNIHMNLVDTRNGQTQVVRPGTTLYFSLPVIRANGNFYSTGYAATLAAIAVKKAEKAVMDRYHANPGTGLDVVGMGNYLRDKINYYMSLYGGSATLTPGSNITVIPTEAKYSGILGMGCP